MHERNICKFITSNVPDSLLTERFIYETDHSVMQNKYKLIRHRVILIKNGSGKFFADGREFSLVTGDLVFAFEGELIYILPDKNFEYMYIDFGGLRSETLFKRFGITPNSRIFSGYDGLIPMWSDSLYRASDINLDLVAESILLYTVSRLVPNTDERNALVNKILAITEERFNDAALSVSEIAKQLSYNPKYISHIFKEKTGVSYTEHLRNLRIKYAVSLLEHGIDSVKNVAFLSGFTDPLYFSSVFKKTVGVSPKDYKIRKENT